MIDTENATYWLCGRSADLILTDPPHMDQFSGPMEHLDFAMRWRTAAAPCVYPNGVLIHSCGPHPAELTNYLKIQVPDQLFVWQHPEADVHHFYLVYGDVPADLGGIARVEKPYPFYDTLIFAASEEGDLVIDPFCGKGEIPIAARSRGRKWAGCDIDPNQTGLANHAMQAITAALASFG